MLRVIPAVLMACVTAACIAAAPQPSVRVGGPDIEHIAFAPDGRTLAVATKRAIELLDVASGNVVDTLSPGGTRVLYSPDGGLLASVGGPARFWSAQTGAPLGATSADVNGHAATFIPGTDLFAYGTSDGSNTVFLWDVRRSRSGMSDGPASPHTWNRIQRARKPGRWVVALRRGRRKVMSPR